MGDLPGVNQTKAARDIAYHLHPFTNVRRLESEGPFVVERGQGIHVYDEQGREYIEAMAGLWSVSLGFSEKRLADAAYKQMLKLPYYSTFGQKSHPMAIALAERLIGMMPVPMSKVFFNNSGSEANDSAVKLVWYYNNALGRPRKKKIIGRMKGYHGVTIASASLCGLPYMHADFDLPVANIRHTDCPHFGRYGKPGESEEDFATRMAENLDSLIQREGPDSVAAFIAEPIQGAGGVIIPPRTYFAKVQEVLKKYDVLFIADEVICGFGRTGSMFGTETFALEPDIITVAKALSSSYLPISATIISEQVFQGVAANSDKLPALSHGYTYSGHPVCAAVALETLKIYEERDIIGHIRKVGPRLQQGLQRLGGHELVGEARGVGLVGALELVKDKKTKESFTPSDGVGAYYEERAREQGIIMRGRGEQLVLAPPLVITESEIEEMLARVERALDATAAWVKNR